MYAKIDEEQRWASLEYVLHRVIPVVEEVFGMMMVNLGMGLITPPVGSVRSSA